MQRFTISLDDALAEAFDALIAARAYENRSEAVRDLLRAELERNRQAEGASLHCVACLSYVFSHHARDLTERLTALQHAHHDLAVSTMHAHLDHEHCLETVILRGPTEAVRKFAQSVSAERGVHHGFLNLISVDAHGSHEHQSGESEGSTHADHPHHLHLRPLS